MELGQLIRQARLEAGLSQRALCADVITRNMLSQIENGSARPSMDTLQYLAGRLGKPVSFFLGEGPEISPNQAVLLQARQETGARALAVLGEYRAPDPVFDPERYLLEALTCLDLAEEALRRNQNGYAMALLEQAQAAGEQTPYYTQSLRRRNLILRFAAGAEAQSLVQRLPELEPELLLRAQAALDGAEPEKAAAYLEAATVKEPYWHFLRGQTYLAMHMYAQAAEHYKLAEAWAPKQIYSRLELCYQALGDYKSAYEYACKQR